MRPFADSVALRDTTRTATPKNRAFPCPQRLLPIRTSPLYDEHVRLAERDTDSQQRPQTVTDRPPPAAHGERRIGEAHAVGECAVTTESHAHRHWVRGSRA